MGHLGSLCFPPVHSLYYLSGLLHGHDWTDGEAELLLVNLFGNGQREGRTVTIAALTMGRNGVVDEGLDAMLGEMSLEIVAARGENGE